VEEKTVIELGAGTGLLGMMASRLGASVVYLTDHDNRSLRHMREDCATNNIHAEVTRLDWFDPDVSIFASVHNLRLIAGDVIYKSNLIGPFMSTAKMLLKPDVKMLLCHVPRAGVTQDIVKAAAIEHGISITRISRDAWNSQAFLEHASLEEIESADLYELCVNAL
jgi:predicted nicotinamide N-methyase